MRDYWNKRCILALIAALSCGRPAMSYGETLQLPQPRLPSELQQTMPQRGALR
jgi:hypothetical protein